MYIAQNLKKNHFYSKCDVFLVNCPWPHVGWICLAAHIWTKSVRLSVSINTANFKAFDYCPLWKRFRFKNIGLYIKCWIKLKCLKVKTLLNCFLCRSEWGILTSPLEGLSMTYRAKPCSLWRLKWVWESVPPSSLLLFWSLCLYTGTVSAQYNPCRQSVWSINKHVFVCPTGGRVNRLWGIIRKFRFNWRIWKPVWEIAAKKSSQVLYSVSNLFLYLRQVSYKV